MVSDISLREIPILIKKQFLGNGIMEKKCPMCAETVKAEALICRFCNHKFTFTSGYDLSRKYFLENLINKSVYPLGFLFFIFLMIYVNEDKLLDTQTTLKKEKEEFVVRYEIEDGVYVDRDDIINNYEPNSIPKKDQLNLVSVEPHNVSNQKETNGTSEINLDKEKCHAALAKVNQIKLSDIVYVKEEQGAYIFKSKSNYTYQAKVSGDEIKWGLYKGRWRPMEGWGDATLKFDINEENITIYESHLGPDGHHSHESYPISELISSKTEEDAELPVSPMVKQVDYKKAFKKFNNYLIEINGKELIDQASFRDNVLTLNVSRVWNHFSYLDRLAAAKGLWNKWAEYLNLYDPDKARLKLLYHGEEVGGSRAWGGSLIWVLE